jgi:chloramphenicol 3-O phosphotransferase
MPDVIVLNGTSSSGKTSIARALQLLLPPTFLTFGIDMFIHALPMEPDGAARGLVIEPGGRITVDAEFRRAEAIWYRGIAEMARAGDGVVIDEVFLDGGRSQGRLAAALAGLDVVWVAVECRLDVTTSRERDRGDRVEGLAAQQHPLVHDGVRYDLRVDTTSTSSLDCARSIVDALHAPRPYQKS